MEKLVRAIARLRRSPVSDTISLRMAGFRKKGKEDDASLFRELCFCLLTANYTSEGGMRIQEAIGDGFLTLPEKRLAQRLRSLGYRFPNARARYIAAARKHLPLRKLLAEHEEQSALRDRLALSILGLGLKESSHFLRNIGYTDLAIIDFHIIDLLSEHGLIGRPRSRSLSRRRYLEIERVLGDLAQRAGMTQGELDLYLWYLETGKILK